MGSWLLERKKQHTEITDTLPKHDGTLQLPEYRCSSKGFDDFTSDDVHNKTFKQVSN